MGISGMLACAALSVAAKACTNGTSAPRPKVTRGISRAVPRLRASCMRINFLVMPYALKSVKAVLKMTSYNVGMSLAMSNSMCALKVPHSGLSRLRTKGGCLVRVAMRKTRKVIVTPSKISAVS